MIAGKFDFTGLSSIVQGKTFRRTIKLLDASGLPLPVGLYEFRCKFKKDNDSDAILYLSTNTGLTGLTPGSEIIREPEDPETELPMEGAIQLYVPDEYMETVLHTAWEEVIFGTAPFQKKKYRGVWELEAEDSISPGDTVPILAGKVNFIREVATS